MSAAEERMTRSVADALDKIKEREVHPEFFHYSTGVRLHPASREKLGECPLAPRVRLSARLTLLLAVKKYENALMKEIIADEEAVADAKAHGQEVELP